MYNLRSIQIFDFLSIENIYYIFNQTEPYIIVGKNLDDSGQAANGSGKSSFVEAIAFTITGLTLRDVPLKKLIRRDQKQARVILTLQSSTNTLIIDRLIDSKASKQTKITFNGAEESKNLSDENAKNQWILNEIGISKEDFFQFYLVTRDRYKPFFISSDNEKKTVINRFSGANIIDTIFPQIDIDIKSTIEIINNNRNDFVRNQMQHDVWQEQLKDLLDQKSDAYKDELISIEEEIINIKKSIETSDEIILNVNEQIAKLDVELKELSVNNIGSLIQQSEKERQTYKDALLPLRSQIDSIANKYQTEITKCDQHHRKLEQKQQAIYESKNETIDILNDTKNKLNSAIECPKCHHEFVIDDDFDVEIGQETIDECKSLIDTFDQQINDNKKEIEINSQKRSESQKKIQTEQNTIQIKINDVNQNIQKVDKMIMILNNQRNENKTKINNIENKIQRFDNDLLTHTTTIQKSNLRIIGLTEQAKKYKDYKPDQAKIDKVKNQIKDTEKKNSELLDVILDYEDTKNVLEAWDINFKNFKSSLANQSIDNIQQYTNLYLQQMGSDISVRIEGYKEQNKKIKEQIDVIVCRSGFDIGIYGEFSGGERCRIDFANILAMQTLINLNSVNGLNFILVDEILEPLDIVGIESIILALKSKNKPLMVVSQQEINSLPKNTITMVKENGITTIK